MKISASFLSIKDNIKGNIELLDKTSIDYLHMDIMDGIFVPNKTWDVDEIKKLIENTNKPRDIHLMVKDPLKYINEYKNFKPDFITFHLEAVDNPFEVMNELRNSNIGIGISIKPDTDIEKLKPYLSYLDLVLVMSVEPGMGGQEFISTSIDKVNDLFKLREDNNYHYLIEVDGGINDKTIQLINNADIAVVGSYITNSDNYQDRIDNL